MTTGDTIWYLIVATVTFLVGIWIADRALQGFSIGVAVMVCLVNSRKWGAAAETWTRHKLGLE
jgi:uncharacterized membrane protein YiaA